MALIGAEPFDLVVLDGMLPGVGDRELVHIIRERAPHVALVEIVTRHSRDVRACDNGGSAILSKPFAFADLVNRCRTLLAPDVADPRYVRQNGMELEMRSRLLRVGEQEITLTKTEALILHHLLSHPQDVATPEMLVRKIWSDPTGSTALMTAIESHIHRLNQRIAKIGGRPIKAALGTGYTLDASALPENPG